MAEFYFVDANLIIGYVNIFDTHYNKSRKLLDDLPERKIILLNSVEAEFNRKIQDQMADFVHQFNGFLSQGITDISVIKRQWNTLSEAFDKYIFNKMEEIGLDIVSRSDIFKIQSEYYQTLQDAFNELTNPWVKYPNQFEIAQIKRSDIYNNAEVKLQPPVLHSYDIEHVCFAIYRAKRRQNHGHIFFTTDQDWKEVNRLFNLNNFKVQIISMGIIYVGRGNKSFFALNIYEKLEFGCFCMVKALGYKINLAVDACLYLRETLLPSLDVYEIKPETISKKGNKISGLIIYLFHLELN